MHAALQQYFGFSTFLDSQEEVVGQVLEGRDLCVVMPTGAGKSLCYQLPILMRPGYGLVVSPLISLMKDQVDALRARNIAAAYLNSTVAPAEQQRLLRETAAGIIKILYVAPERFRASGFRRMLQQTPPALLVVDEAHCISQWGHDFRPDYLRLGEAISELEVPQVCAFTATATPLVRQDICTHLHRPDMNVHVAGFQRPNLSFSVLNCSSASQKLTALGDLLQKKIPTIIYTSTRKAVDEIAAQFDCVGYHAGLSDQQRHEAQERFMHDPCPVLVATNAFGMGIDRPDVRRVIHYNMPGTLEAYYQEAGRAGRDGEPAECILLFAYQDRFVQEFLIDMNNPSPTLLAGLYAVLRRQMRERQTDHLEIKAAELAEQVAEAKTEKHVGSALSILEKYGYVERGYRQQNRGRLRFQGQLNSLRLVHQHQATQRSRFIYRCLVHFGEALAGGVEVSYEELAGVAGLQVEQIQRVLRALKGEVLDWCPPFAGRVISLCHPDQAELKIDLSGLTRKREFALERLEEVIAYTRTKECRQRALVAYFGQEVGKWKCESCDLCRQLDHALHRPPTPEEKPVVAEILRTVLGFEGRFGRGRIAQLLAGSRNQEITRYRLDEHPSYARLQQVGQAHLMKFLDSLEKAGCIMRVGDPQYPCIDITPYGINVLDGREPVRLDFPPSTSPTHGPSRQTSPQAGRLQAGARAGEDDLIGQLRRLRGEMAAKRQVPAYRILSDAALLGLAEARPLTSEEATRVKGIGDIKARTIVPAFLDVIVQWRRQTVG